MPLIKLSVSERRRLTAFIVCVILAGVSWLFIAMSNSYQYVVKEVVSFKNAPQRRAFHPLQSDTVDVKVQGSGWQMLFYKLNVVHNRIVVDVSELDNRNFVVLNAQLNQINNSKEVNRQIIAFSPDTLYFDFTNRAVKKVPVQLVLDVRYRQQYALTNDIEMIPAYVTVSGPANSIAQIAAWKTDSLKLRDVFETVDARVPLQPVRETNLTVYPKNVEVKLPVDEYTEKTVDVPVKLINNRNYYSVKIFPQKIKVTFTVPLSRYTDTDEDLFEATADLDLWKNNGYPVLPVKIATQPSYTRIVKTDPPNIDFIIKK